MSGGPSLRPASVPTMYFIGVTTADSLIMRVFQRWASLLELGDCELRGIDLPPRAPAADYRAVVDFLAADPRSLGALVTTHKLDLYAACRDRFDDVDAFAALMQETSSLSKRDGRLACRAKDPISSNLALEAFLAPGHWRATGGAAFLAGAGGAATIAWALRTRQPADDRPSRIVVSDVDAARLDALAAVMAKVDSDVPAEYVLAAGAADNDAIVAALPAGSLVVNATGLGKDRPGSPLTDAAVFPEGGLAWELNYRGDLVFLDQARSQAASRGLRVEDGWTYFIHGWTQVIADVFDRPIPTSGPGFDALAAAAGEVRGHPRVIATPHVGGYTGESVARAAPAAVDNLLAALAPLHGKVGAHPRGEGGQDR